MNEKERQNAADMKEARAKLLECAFPPLAGMDQNGREEANRRGRKRGRLRPEHQHEPRRQEHDSLAVERGGSFPGLPSGLDAVA